jgi:hypothetical protein
VGTIATFCDLVLVARTSLEAASRILRLIFPGQAERDEIPHSTSGRWWLLRLGYYKLHRPKAAGEWVWMIDHTVQIGKEKCLAIAGVLLSHLPPLGDCLELKHLEPIALLPVAESNGQIVHQQLEKIACQVGIPRAIVSDEGHDLRGGITRFCRNHDSTAFVSDMPHKAARLLKHRLEKNERWLAYCTHVGQTKFRTGQTELAFLVPPQQRRKARFMNLGPLLKWGTRTLQVIDQRPSSVLAYCTAERLEEKFGWLREYREDLAQWSELQALADQAVDLVRRQGYSAETARTLPDQLSQHVRTEAGRKMRHELVEFVSLQAQAVSHGRLPGSTEVLESSFGKLKSLEGDHHRGGFTGLLLAWAALCGETSRETIEHAMNSTPTKLVKRWISEHLGTTLHSQRRTAYNETVVQAQEKPQES